MIDWWGPILFEYYAGTDPTFSGQYDQHWDRGAYHCACCGHALFDSESKFNPGCGWPSFHSELDEAGIVQRPDFSHGMSRVELLCPQCDAHLGHVGDLAVVEPLAILHEVNCRLRSEVVGRIRVRNLLRAAVRNLPETSRYGHIPILACYCGA